MLVMNLIFIISLCVSSQTVNQLLKAKSSHQTSICAVSLQTLNLLHLQVSVNYFRVSVLPSEGTFRPRWVNPLLSTDSSACCQTHTELTST